MRLKTRKIKLDEERGEKKISQGKGYEAKGHISKPNIYKLQKVASGGHKLGAKVFPGCLKVRESWLTDGVREVGQTTAYKKQIKKPTAKKSEDCSLGSRTRTECRVGGCILAMLDPSEFPTVRKMRRMDVREGLIPFLFLASISVHLSFLSSEYEHMFKIHRCRSYCHKEQLFVR